MELDEKIENVIIKDVPRTAPDMTEVNTDI